MPSASPGRSVTAASAFGRSPAGQAVHLMQRDEFEAVAERADGAAAVLADRSRIVGRAEPDVEAGEDAVRHAAGPAQEGVGQRRERGSAGDVERHLISPRGCGA
jgi:hypothetical protein